MQRYRVYGIAITFLLGMALDPDSLPAQDKTLVRIDDIYPEDLRLEGFELDANREIAIQAVGFYYRDEGIRVLLGNAWILDSKTRDVVWDLADSRSRSRRRGLIEFSDEISLPKGSYEVYFASYPIRSLTDVNIEDLKDLGEILGSLFRGWFRGDRDSYRKDVLDLYRDFKIVVTGNGKSVDRDDIYAYHDKQKSESLVWISGYKKNTLKNFGLIANKPVELDVYSIGEVMSDGKYDYGWIYDLDSREKVWELSYRRSEAAGGAKKNRMNKSRVRLEKGRYVVSYATDDSHSPRKWNSQPPYDPEFWGLLVRLKNESDRKKVEFFDYDNFTDERMVVDMTRMRNGEMNSYGFTLKKDMELNVYAVGEGRRGEMFDYGWIIDADNRERIWEMNYRDTEHAGGADKNRVFDSVISFSKGNYIAYFVTDGSHSYRMWNTSPPSDQEAWGMRLISLDPKFKKESVEEYEEKENKNILAQIVNVGDDEMVSARFNLDRRTKVRVYAIGEGRRGHMHDFGWIENVRSGRTVWEMTYRMTDHAGGAKKNRMFDGTIVLEPGEYVARYETDDSHSFNDWNASRPYDPFNWGITVRVAEK
ncbi:MAG: hypothetical protein IH825_05330 [Candidatus Marinimicrobia bacterium]|nr:hypothetical protein [Candidatus Neomarinimicrobiota bacterium]